jgi:hypothetical protein
MRKTKEIRKPRPFTIGGFEYAQCISGFWAQELADKWCPSAVCFNDENGDLTPKELIKFSVWLSYAAKWLAYNLEKDKVYVKRIRNQETREEKFKESLLIGRS